MLDYTTCHCVCVCVQMEERKDAMLQTSLQCFQSASRCECHSDEEEWLIHYMLGKIAEKRKQAPPDFLQLYQKVTRGRPPALSQCRSSAGCWWLVQDLFPYNSKLINKK